MTRTRAKTMGNLWSGPRTGRRVWTEQCYRLEIGAPCPLCGAAVRFLYAKPQAPEQWACRTCHRLAYQSQSRRALTNDRRRAQALGQHVDELLARIEAERAHRQRPRLRAPVLVTVEAATTGGMESNCGYARQRRQKMKP